MTFLTTVITKGRAGALATLVVAAIAVPALAASTATDAWITAKVKLSLATAAGVSATDVNVDTIGRHVTLHGTVNTAAEKETAERTAKTVTDVAAVHNLLQVVPAKNEAAVDENDDEISSRVSTALVGTPSLKSSTISVQSVNKGVVLLKGNARSLSDHLTAVQVARDVKGVRGVASEVQSPDALADAEVWMEPNIAVSGSAAHSARSAANDLYITTMVKTRLLADPETPAMEINVDNQLQVVAAAKQPAVDAKDDVVQDNVRKNLQQHSGLGSVGSEVKNCVVRLTGTVPSGLERVEAMQVARATKGVCSVNEDLTIR